MDTLDFLDTSESLELMDILRKLERRVNLTHPKSTRSEPRRFGTCLPRGTLLEVSFPAHPPLTHEGVNRLSLMKVAVLAVLDVL